jgi:predicted nucleic acid-binding protein
MKKYVLDACALIALFQKEPGSDVIEDLLIEANNGFCSIMVNSVNLLEVYYGYLRADGEDYAERHLSAVQTSCIEVVETITSDFLRQAGKLKTAYSMSLADSILLAQAKLNDAIVVTSDHHELDAVNEAGEVDFLWFRK